MKRDSSSISCPTCHQSFSLSASSPAHFCPLCGHPLNKPSESEAERPAGYDLLSHRYQLLENIGKGGMGEVFLAFDTVCGRRIALKKIRSDLLNHPHIRHRF